MENMTLAELLNVAKQQMHDLSNLTNPDFRLEQAEYNKSDKSWDIVVSYLVDNTNKRLNPLTTTPTLTTEFQYHRIYKKVKIDDNKHIAGFYMFNNN